MIFQNLMSLGVYHKNWSKADYMISGLIINSTLKELVGNGDGAQPAAAVWETQGIGGGEAAAGDWSSRLSHIGVVEIPFSAIYITHEDIISTLTIFQGERERENCKIRKIHPFLPYRFLVQSTSVYCVRVCINRNKTQVSVTLHSLPIYSSV